MSNVVYANDALLSVPQQVSEPVAVHLPENTIDWAHVKPQDILQVFVGLDELCCDDRTPIAGRHELDDHTLTFTPAFGFVTDQPYVARVRIAGQGETLVEFNVPTKTQIVEARVTGTYPSAELLPENILRFYIHFSVPMSPHVAFDYIKLRNADGVADKAAFMRFKQELWNEDRTRLTILIDPGRIKRDVATNLELGPALLAGKHYTLSVDSGWQSADGASYLPEYSRMFTVSEGLRERPDARHWRSSAPCRGTNEPLEIGFDRPFDRHGLNNAIRVVTEEGQVVSGTAFVGDNENSWRFYPDEPWNVSVLRVIVDATLEDIAGNNFRDLLDQASDTRDSKASVTSMTINLENCSGNEKPKDC